LVLLKTSQKHPKHQQWACQGCPNGETDVALADQGRGDWVFENIILHKVCPGGSRPSQSHGTQVDPICRDLQGCKMLYDPILYGMMGALKGLCYSLLKLFQGRKAPNGRQMNPVSDFSNHGQMICPALVYSVQLEPSLEINRGLTAYQATNSLIKLWNPLVETFRSLLPHQDAPSFLVHNAALQLNDVRVGPQRLPYVKIPPFYDSLGVGNLLPDHWIVYRFPLLCRFIPGWNEAVKAIVLQQIIFKADEKAG
jgi:hypothetical protein